VNGLIGFIVMAGISFLMWLLSNAAKQGQEKDAAEMQRKILAAKQQGAPGRAEPKKKYRQLEELRNKAGDVFVSATMASPPRLKRESVFDDPIDGAPDNYVDNASGLATDAAPMAQQLSEHANPIAQEIMTMLGTPQSMQQVVILSEIFSRPKSVS